MSGEFTIYDQIGGDATFRRLVESFYARIAQDELLRDMFPQDLEGARERQFLFLTQFFGGPQRYSEQRGHPRLRMRHQPFPIDGRARQRWLELMLAAVDEAGIEEPARSLMRSYFERSSQMLINREDNPDSTQD